MRNRVRKPKGMPKKRHLKKYIRNGVIGEIVFTKCFKCWGKYQYVWYWVDQLDQQGNKKVGFTMRNGMDIK